jgi:hypothetical protein
MGQGSIIQLSGWGMKLEQKCCEIELDSILETSLAVRTP